MSQTDVISQLNGSSELAIEVDSLHKTYSQGLVRRRKLDALKGVSFSVQRGEVFGLLGPNGAGKTTFLKILLGIIRKTSGSATMLGYSAGSRLGRRRVGYLPEHFRVPSHLTGYGALDLYGQLSNLSRRTIRGKRDELIELVGLSGRAKDRVKQYSKGMRQRLGLAQALLHEPQLLVLDEPTDGLDPQARAEVRQVIGSLKERGVTVFLNSHLLQEVEMICDRVAILNQGELRYCGAVDQVGEFVNNLTSTDSGQSPNAAAAAIEVLLEIQGSDPKTILPCFQGYQFDVQSNKENLFQVAVKLNEQAELDQLVDRLRAASISVLSIERQRISLEEAFLEIVTHKHPSH